MPHINVDGLWFEFPDRWTASKYDDWVFYRNQWTKMRSGVKSVDILAVDPERTGWLIEVKDYSKHPRTKPSDLAQEIADKVFDTLAAMLPVRVNATDDTEKFVASPMARAMNLRVVLHLEQPVVLSRLRPHVINPADIRQRLKQLLKPVDPHPAVTAMAQMAALPWQVARS